MKKFSKILACLLLVSLLCGVIVVSVAANDSTEETVANQLIPNGAVNLICWDFNEDSTQTVYNSGASFVTYRKQDGNGYYAFTPNANSSNTNFSAWMGLTSAGTGFSDYSYLVFEMDFGSDSLRYQYDSNGDGTNEYHSVTLADYEVYAEANAAEIKRYDELAALVTAGTLTEGAAEYGEYTALVAEHAEFLAQRTVYTSNTFAQSAWIPFNEFGFTINGKHNNVLQVGDHNYLNPWIDILKPTLTGVKRYQGTTEITATQNNPGNWNMKSMAVLNPVNLVHFTAVFDVRSDTELRIYYYLAHRMFAYDVINYAAAGISKDELVITNLHMNNSNSAQRPASDPIVNTTADVNRKGGYSVVFDNITLNAYTAETAGSLTTTYVDNYAPTFTPAVYVNSGERFATYSGDKEYVKFNPTYINVDNDSTDGVNEIADRVYDSTAYAAELATLTNGGTIYANRAVIPAFIPNAAVTEFTVKLRQGATFTAPAGYEVVSVSDYDSDGYKTYEYAVPNDAITVSWVAPDGESVLYEEDYITGDTPVFNPKKIDTEMLALYRQIAGVVETGTTAKFVSLENPVEIEEYTDGAIFEDGKVTQAEEGVGGYIALQLSSVETPIVFALYDADGVALLANNADDNTVVTKLAEMYAANKDDVALIKFFGNSQDLIYIPSVAGYTLSIPVSKELTVDLNGQKLLWGNKTAPGGSYYLFTLNSGSTLNVNNGSVFSANYYLPTWQSVAAEVAEGNAKLATATGSNATINFGVNGDEAKALKYYGSTIVETPSTSSNTTVNLYGGLYQSGNCVSSTTGALFTCDGTGAINIYDADIISASQFGGVFTLRANVTVTATDSDFICNNTSSYVGKSTYYFVREATAGTVILNNSRVYSKAPATLASGSTFSMVLGEGTLTNWDASLIGEDKGCGITVADGFDVVANNSTVNTTYTYAHRFLPWTNGTEFKNYSLATYSINNPTKYGSLPDSFFELAAITHNEAFTMKVATVFTVVYKDANGAELTSQKVESLETIVHPSITIAGLREDLNNNWFDVAYGEWVAHETEANVFVPSGYSIIDDVQTVKVTLDLMSHLALKVMVPASVTTDDYTITTTFNTSGNLGGEWQGYKWRAMTINSTWLDSNFAVTFSYTVNYAGESATFTKSFTINMNDYLEVVLDEANEALYSDSYETLLTLMQYRYNNAALAGTLNEYPVAKALYEEMFVKYSDYCANLANLTMPADEIKTVVSGTYLKGASYDLPTNQPYVVIYVAKEAYDALGEGASVTMRYLTETVVTTNDGTASVVATTDYAKLLDPEGTEMINSVECYLFKILPNDLCNATATFEVVVKDAGGEVLQTIEYSLATYINSLNPETEAAALDSAKALYAAAKASWDYKVTVVEE